MTGTAQRVIGPLSAAAPCVPGAPSGRAIPVFLAGAMDGAAFDAAESAVPPVERK